MLFSEEKERQNRFLISLKIAFPLVLTVFLFVFIFNDRFDDNFNRDDIILFIILFVCYVYYIIYLIYFAFKNSSLDPVTRVFTREYIYKYLSSKINRKKELNIVLINFSNLVDINERYGHKNGDNLLRKFVLELSNFLKNNGMTKISIGRYSGENFIFCTDIKMPKLMHILKKFSADISNEGINNIEVIIKYAAISSKFDTNLQNIINALFMQIQDGGEEKPKVIKLDYFDELVCYSINNRDFQIKFQTVKSQKDSDDLIDLNIKLVSPEIGIIPRTKILYITKNNNYEVVYDIELITHLSNIIDFNSLENKIIIEISTVSLRNMDFKNSLVYLIDNKKIDPKKIIFEFWEKTIYHELNRFDEIIKQFKELGFSFALSHFGGDNAGFKYIRFLDIDYVIYDMEFNKTINSEKSQIFFEFYQNMMKRLDIKTVIRFIDKENLYNKFLNLNIDYIQGFYIDKPRDNLIKG